MCVFVLNHFLCVKPFLSIDHGWFIVILSWKCAAEKVIAGFIKLINMAHTVFPRFSAPGRLLVFEVFGGTLNRAGALIKTYENLDLPFPAHTGTLFVIYDN